MAEPRENKDIAEEFVKNVLFVNNWQRQNPDSPLSNLINLATLDPLPSTFSSIDISEYFVFLNRQPVEPNVSGMKDLNEAYQIMFRNLPFVDKLSFNGYVLAGGAVLDCVRRNNDRWSRDSYPSDFDFFIVSGKGSETERTSKAMVIMKNFYSELKAIWGTEFQGTHEFRWLLNENCLTIYFMNKKEYIWEHNRLPTMEERKFKFQIIFRAYTTKTEIPLGFDLPVSQWLYDGHFKTTYSGYVSTFFKMNIIDVKRCSKSMTYRVAKYHRHKNIGPLFPGISRDDFLTRLNRNTSLKCFKFKFDTYADPVIMQSITVYGSDNERPTFDNINKIDYMPDKEEIRDENILGASSHVSDYEDVKDSTINRSTLSMDDVTSMINLKQFLRSGYIYLGGDATSDPFENIQIPTKTRLYVAKTAISLISMSNVDAINILFGDFAEAAMIELLKIKQQVPKALYMDLIQKLRRHLFKSDPENWRSKINGPFSFLENYAALIELASKKIEETLSIEFQNLMTISWRLTDPGQQDYGAYNPLNLNARKFYQVPDEYNVDTKEYIDWDPKQVKWSRYHISWMWEQKMTIIRAWYSYRGDVRFISEKTPKETSLIGILPYEVMKLIFSWLDSYHVRTIINVLK